MTERKLQITVEAIDKATDELKAIRQQIEGLDKAGKKGGAGLKETGKGADFLNGKLGPMLVKVTGVTSGLVAMKKAMDFTADATLLSARVETLGVVTERLGANVGMTRYEIHQEEKAIQELGITTQASRQAIAQMIESNVDLSYSTKLAREAQDAAVIAGINSSEAYERLVTVIASGNVEMARTMGLNVNFQRAYKQTAEQLNKTTDSLTETEKAQARANEVIRAGSNITGTYSAAMETAGKQLSSLPRYLEEFKVAFGNNYQEPLKEGISLTRDFLKAETDLMNNNQMLRKAIEQGIITQQEYNNAFQSGSTIRMDVTKRTELLERAEAGLELKERQLSEATKVVAGETRYYAKMMTEATDETAALEREQTMYEGQLKQLQGFISGKLGPTNEEFTQTQEDLRAKMKEVNDEADHLVSLGWSEQSSKVQDLRGKYGELATQFEETAAAHEEATKRMMLDLVIQQASVDGLSTAEMELIAGLAGPEGWGLIDQATADAMANTNQMLEDLNTGVLTSSDVVAILAGNVDALAVSGGWSQIDENTSHATGSLTEMLEGLDSNVEESGVVVQRLAGSLDALATNRSATITIYHRDIYLSDGPGPDDQGDIRYGTPRAVGGPVAAGSPYIVNERVTTRPEVFVPSRGGYIMTRQDAQRALAGGGGRSISIGSINVSGAGNPDAVADRVIQKLQQKLSLQGVSL